MNRDKTNSRQRGGLLLVALMLVFVFVNSLHEAKTTDKNAGGKLTLSAGTLQQIVFLDSQNTLKSLPDLTSKIQIFATEFNSITLDLPSLEIATCEALLITKSLYNTFYTNILIHAP